MGEEAPEIKRPAGLGIFQPGTDCKDDSNGRLQDESKRYRPAHPANDVLPKLGDSHCLLLSWLDLSGAWAVTWLHLALWTPGASEKRRSSLSPLCCCMVTSKVPTCSIV